MRQAHDNLEFTLENKHKKLKDIQSVIARTEVAHIDQPKDKRIKKRINKLRKGMDKIDEARVNHDLESEQLHHMFLTYKADILSQQLKIQILKESLKESKKHKEKLSQQYQHLKRQCFQYQDRIVGIIKLE
jgi:chromosome segregation ATPase